MEYGGILLERSIVEKYFAPFNWEKISSTFDRGQIYFCLTLLGVW